MNTYLHLGFTLDRLSFRSKNISSASSENYSFVHFLWECSSFTSWTGLSCYNFSFLASGFLICLEFWVSIDIGFDCFNFLNSKIRIIARFVIAIGGKIQIHILAMLWFLGFMSTLITLKNYKFKSVADACILRNCL